MSAKTLAGLEQTLSEEIASLGGTNIRTGKRIVFFEGNDELMMKANLSLRTALNILIPFYEFDAVDEEQLYEEIYDFPWEDIFSLRNTFSIQATVAGDLFTHSKYVALKTKDAIADRFRKICGRRPNVEVRNADYQFVIHINYNHCFLSLNSSGQGLDKRGYRLQSNEAPLNEAMAAGIILKSKWDKLSDIYDPMSGSGTFGIEAALIGTNTPPGIHRRFAFQTWNDYNQELFYEVLNNLKSNITELKANIYSKDITHQNLEIIHQNASRAGVEELLEIEQGDYFESEAKSIGGIIYLNPPYGERMAIEDAKAEYKLIGDQLKKKYKSCDAWIISSNIAALKAFGLKPESKEIVYNGGLECRLQHYKLF